jgi:hypothetical protein
MGTDCRNSKRGNVVFLRQHDLDQVPRDFLRRSHFFKTATPNEVIYNLEMSNKKCLEHRIKVFFIS